MSFSTRFGTALNQESSTVEKVVDGKQVSETTLEPCNFYYCVTLEGVPISDLLVIEKDEKNVLDDKPSETIFEDLFDSAMSLVD